tara:strand:- start:909 stop:1151 length:243 start_codon:yes stop_codon:yes gene_type:complete
MRKQIEDTSKYDDYISGLLVKMGKNRVEGAELFRDLMTLAQEFGDEDLIGSLREYGRENQKLDKMMLKVIEQLRNRRDNQ